MTGNNCDEALEELYGYLDGELTEERRALIGAHIDDCTPCLDAFDFEVELRQVLSRKFRDTVPDDLRRRIADALGIDTGTA